MPVRRSPAAQRKPQPQKKKKNSTLFFFCLPICFVSPRTFLRPKKTGPRHPPPRRLVPFGSCRDLPHGLEQKQAQTPIQSLLTSRSPPDLRRRRLCRRPRARIAAPRCQPQNASQVHGLPHAGAGLLPAHRGDLEAASGRRGRKRSRRSRRRRRTPEKGLGEVS